MTRPPDLTYAVDDHPPWAILVVSALQHIGVIAITLIFPIIIARRGEPLRNHSFSIWSRCRCSGLALPIYALCDPFENSSARLSVRGRLYGDLSRPFAVRAAQGGLALVFGMTVVRRLVQLAFAPLLHRLRALLPSEIAGLVIAVVGLTLAGLGVRYSPRHHMPQPEDQPGLPDRGRDLACHHGGAEHLDKRLRPDVLRADRNGGRISASAALGYSISRTSSRGRD
jgi:xanthine/uracil permease